MTRSGSRDYDKCTTVPTRAGPELRALEVPQAQRLGEVLDGLRSSNSEDGNAEVEARVKQKVIALTDRFPIYPTL